MPMFVVKSIHIHINGQVYGSTLILNDAYLVTGSDAKAVEYGHVDVGGEGHGSRVRQPDPPVHGAVVVHLCRRPQQRNGGHE